MKLLIITQKIDERDPVLGFFVNWVARFAERFERTTVICLERGKHHLPSAIKVLSLGKESGRSRLKYLWRFYKYIWQERKNYDAVFVHMNQEYVLLGWKFWKLFGKKIFLWRNHPAGSWRTDLAVWFCDKVFCTSRFSYTARFRKTVLMPVGIDLEIFKPDPLVQKIPHSILFLARLAPVKRPDLLLRALAILRERGIDFTANFYGDALPADAAYAQSLRTQAAAGLSGAVHFFPAVPNNQTPALYRRHEIFVNLSPSGMFDKTIFEAAACGTLALNSNQNLRDQWDERLLFCENDASDLADRLALLLALPDEEYRQLAAGILDQVSTEHSLARLIQELHAKLV